MSNADQWRWTDDEGVQRLLRGDELRAALADGRLKPTTLVWKRGMKNWVAACEVAELKDAIDDDGPETVTKQVPKNLGKKAMPTPSIPPPGARAPVNMVDINALRAAGVRNPVNTLTGIGDKDGLDAKNPTSVVQGDVKIPSAPKVPQIDGGWRDGAARRDRREDTVTALVKDDEGSTLSEHATNKKKTVPPPRKKGNTLGQSRKPPPPVRARRTAPLGGAAGLAKTLKPTPPAGKPTHPSVPPPVGSSEVLSDMFDAGRPVPKKAAATKTAPGTGAARGLPSRASSPPPGTAPSQLGPAPHGKPTGKQPSLPPPRRPSVPAPQPAPAPPQAPEPPVDAGAHEVAGPARAPSAAASSADASPPPPSSTPALAELAAAVTSVKPPGPKGPMAKTGPLPEIGQLESLSPDAPQPAEPRWNPRNEPAPQPARAQPAVSMTRGADLAPTEIPPKPPAIAGLTLKYPIAAGVGAAVLLAVVLSFVVGRFSAPAKSQLSQVLKARSGWAIVPLFARTKALAVHEPRPCLMLRAPSRFAPGATPRIPVEVTAVSEHQMAVGFAQNDATPRGLVVDPATGKAEMVFQPEPPADDEGSLERIMPLVSGAEVTFGVTPDSQEGLYRSVYVPADKPFVVGFDKENVLKADAPGGAAERIWSLKEGAGRGEGLRVAAAPGVGFPLTYRQRDDKEGKGVVFYAMLDESGAVAHQAVALAAPEGDVGKPYIAAGGGSVSVVFAHRLKVEGARWELRWARGPVGEPLKDAALVDIPAGGPGGDAGAPAITPLSGGRWLLMWMEGSSGAWTIRAQTFDRKFRPLGEALRVSPETGNFGQGVVGVVGEKGVVVFLLEALGDYEVWGTVLQCQ